MTTANSAKLISDPNTENAIRMMEIQAVNFAYRFIKDARVRQTYLAETKAMAEGLRESYKTGLMSAKKAADAANQMRNEIMEFARVKSSDLGRAKARALKVRGLDMDDLTSKYAKRLFRKTFEELSEAQRNQVYMAIVDSSGRPNPSVSLKTRRLGTAGRCLWVLTACIAVYNVSTADNKMKAAGREGSNIGGGFGGGAAGGAVAGIWFGPVGVAIGVIIGGVLGAIVADQVYVELAGPDGDFARSFIPRFTNMVSTKEKAMAAALVKECGYELDKVNAVFLQLSDKYSTDADDVALEYVKQVKDMQGPVKEALRLHVGLRNNLIALLDGGWTTGEEQNCIAFLTNM